LRNLIGGGTVEYHESIPSTQLRAQELAREGVSKAVVVAEEQTKGRGRIARRWESPKGSGLYFSILFRPALPPAAAYLVNVAAALSVAEAVESLLGLGLELKWPNDLLLAADAVKEQRKERKVCGILSESATRNGALDYCVTGIGINVRKPPCLPPEIAESSGWLSQASDPIEIHNGAERALLCRVVEIFFGWVEAMEREGTASMLAAYRKKCASIGRAVKVETGTETLIGTCSDIGDGGELIVETPSGIRRFHVADVTHARLA
jgi:BirA family biotin operon repressor/biotin-[acetyl-CoA-carboxylase] ligase